MDKNLITKKEIEQVIEILITVYPDATCSLAFQTPFQLAVSLILAAQCTDNMVNRVTPILFAAYPTIESIAKASVEDIAKIVKPCGFYKTKANNIVLTAKAIIEQYGGIMPDTMEQLTTLYGIGRKSSNIILQECYGKVVGIAVDTHVSRISKRIGFTKESIPLKQEQELIHKIDKKYFAKINHILVYHGRAICTAKKPNCNECPIKTQCRKNGLTKKEGSPKTT